jgi:NAD(P)-dependent dehydrogenase (short-subunit alcohol dehydrogenase family)
VNLYNTALIKSTASAQKEARIVIVSSEGFRLGHKPDYKALTTAVPGDGPGLRGIVGAFRRYTNSKLLNIYFTYELDRRIRAEGVSNVWVNCCHPGTAGGTSLGAGSLGPWLSWLETFIRGFASLVGNTTLDSAKTQTFLAASKTVVDGNVHGQYWMPNFSWNGYYVNCGPGKMTQLSEDVEERQKLWDFSEKAVEKAGSASS